jgi:broad specificity phosphatase PhoE
MQGPLPSPAPHECWMFLLRHGSTANNTARPQVLQGCASDIELSPEGLAEAEKTARFLTTFPFAACYASPLRRAAETARIVAAPHGLAVQTVAELREADLGAWEGKSWPRVEAEDPAAYRRFVADPGAVPYGGGESFQMVVDRVGPAFQQIFARHRGRQVLVVAHNVVNRAYLATCFGVPLARARDIRQTNCGVNILRSEDAKIEVWTCNSALHLWGA